ncbi:uroporphyrinogen-III synthase [Zhihengliuella sp.]|uniref:uroporphyrinogen-III synthase n=1 Tax=Zhihengliuella sp. TaxID=1954483 RepID=UPI0028111CB6|nr:uroporphyrinogen-III synthase [Zhihengliuella sp.]
METPAPVGSTERDGRADHDGPGSGEGSLAGFRIGVTSDRRSADLIEALERRGAEVLHAPVLKIAPVAEDADLQAETAALIAARPDVVLVTTAYGMRRWIDSADAHGQGEELTRTLERATILVRGPKARGAVRAAGFDDDGVSPDERTTTMVDLALERGVAGRTVAIQLHGLADADEVARLEAAGARVLTVSPYRWVVPEGSEEKVARLIDAVCNGGLDLVTFTAAPAVDALWDAARQRGRYWDLVEAFQTHVVAATVGPVTAQPLQVVGIDPLIPERFRMGAMIRQIVEFLGGRGTRHYTTALGDVALRGAVVALGGETRELGASQLALFRAIADARGAVLSRAELIAILPEGQGDHALDMAVSRLRRALPDPGLVATVVKRGYRLNV